MIQKHLSKIIYLIAVSVIFASCTFDELYYSTDTNCHIRLHVDWTQTKFRLNGASVYVYHKTGDLYKAFPPFSNPYTIDLALPKGDYNLVLHNNTPYELPNLNFYGLEHAETLRVGPVMNTDPNYKLTSVLEPDDLGLAHLTDLTVTETMIDYFPFKPGSADHRTFKEFDLMVESVVTEIEIIVHVTGLNNASAAPPSEFRNVSGGLYMMTKKKQEELVTHHFILNNRTFDPGSNKNGTIRKTLKCFGPVDDKTVDNLLLMNFKLANGEQHPVLLNATDKLEKISDLKYRVRLECTLPDVPAVGEGDSGFDPGVEDWEDIEVDIPMG